MSPARPDRVGGLGPGELRARYSAGALSPVEVVDEVYARIAERGQDHVWITLVEQQVARAAAAALDPGRIEELPLFGIPFAVKDNIDVAGLPTTAACPGFAYPAAASAPLVNALVAAGAILIGKTNLDQFATGLSGARSPFGAPASVGDRALISGGSSSGSAVSVAAGLVGFAIGTDTAGSGRVPAALNGVVGLKPSIGLVSATGIVPACRSLDCASVFAGSVADAQAVLAVVAGFDPADPWARRFREPTRTPSALTLSGLRLAVPASVPGWGARGEPEAWRSYCDRLAGLGVELVPVDLTVFFEAGELLYSGPWVAERLDGLEDVLARQPDVLLPVTRTILELGRAVRGTETFAALTRLQGLRREAADLLARVDALLTPTVTETFTIQEMLADPISLNARLGRFTTFTNLLDLCAVAIPAGGGEVPFGVTVQAAAGRDGFLLGLAHALERAVVGAEPAPVEESSDDLLVAVVGAHLHGMPLNGDLVERGAVLVERTTTAPSYRLYALPGGPPERPGLRRVSSGGAKVEVEVYRMPRTELGGFLETVPPPLGLGTVLLADGNAVVGFICEEAGYVGARDVTGYGGWRGYLASDSR